MSEDQAMRLRRALAGDGRAFEELLVPVLGPAFRLAMTMLNERSAAEDAVQEAALKAWRKLRRFRAGSQLRPWFLAIVANECRSVRRTRWWNVIRLSELAPRRAAVDRSAELIDLDVALDRLPQNHLLALAFDSRSGDLSPGFQSRLSATLREGRPVSDKFVPAVAVVAAIVLTIAIIAVLVSSRHVGSPVGNPTASGARLASPTPTRIPMPSTAQLSAPSSNVVWVLVADSRLFRSTDQGSTWEERPLPSELLLPPSISFVGDHEGWLLTGGSPQTQCNAQTIQLWHTVDAGVSWQRMSSAGIGDPQCKEYISFVDSTHGFVTAWDPNQRPTIYRTADGGKTWTGSTLPDPPDFKTVAGGTALRAGVVKRFGNTLFVEAWGMQGGDTPSRQYVFRSIDGGATWSWLTKIPSKYVAMVTQSRWLQLVVPGQSMETTTSGQQWHLYASDFNTDTPVGGPQIVFTDSQVGYAKGRGALQRTADGGLHWVRIATPGV